MKFTITAPSPGRDHHGVAKAANAPFATLFPPTLPSTNALTKIEKMFRYKETKH